MDTPLEYARRYHQNGWAILPVPLGEKNPGRKGWPDERYGEDDLEEVFGRPTNVGVLTGEDSNGLIDIDLDHPLAVELADQFLPPTPAVFGRGGKPRSHRLYTCAPPPETEKYEVRERVEGKWKKATVAELRSGGGQTIFPPSLHKDTGERIEWVDPDAVPASVSGEVLVHAFRELCRVVYKQLGKPVPPRLRVQERRDGKQERSRHRARLLTNNSDETTASTIQERDEDDEQDPLLERVKRCRRAMQAIRPYQNRDGSHRLFTYCCRAVEHDITDDVAITLIRELEREHPFPVEWTDEDLLQRVRDAEKRCTRGVALEDDEDGLVPLGHRDPETGKLVLSPRRTLPTARAFLDEFYSHPEGMTLCHQAAELLAWRGTHFVICEDNEVKAQLLPWLHGAVRYMYDRKSKGLVLVPFDANPATVNSALESVRPLIHLPNSLATPCWLDRQPGLPDPREIIACRSTLFHLPTGTRMAPTPAYFTRNALEFDPNPNAPAPTNWLAFLDQLFNRDKQATDLLQEWFAYCLACNTTLQKMLLIVGPRRSGKGTIARVLRHLIGHDNVCGPTTSSLAENFGLQPLLGKSLAIISDARFAGDGITTVVERLLCISGEDAISVHRKYKDAMTVKLPTRLLFLSNELPTFRDASGALSGRFLILQLTKSFYGNEDPELTDRLLTELPGIFNWALEGWMRLWKRGHFQQPDSSTPAVEELEDLSSPVGQFVREKCVVEAGARTDTSQLFAVFKRWCEDGGRQHIQTIQVFGRDLRTVAPNIARRRSTHEPYFEGIRLK